MREQISAFSQLKAQAPVSYLEGVLTLPQICGLGTADLHLYKQHESRFLVFFTSLLFGQS